MDFREYAIHHLQSSLDKTDDAPASSDTHLAAARLALIWERVPAVSEVNAYLCGRISPRHKYDEA